jgi:hypothetical protein
VNTIIERRLEILPSTSADKQLKLIDMLKREITAQWCQEHRPSGYHHLEWVTSVVQGEFLYTLVVKLIVSMSAEESYRVLLESSLYWLPPSNYPGDPVGILRKKIVDLLGGPRQSELMPAGTTVPA